MSDIKPTRKYKRGAKVAWDTGINDKPRAISDADRLAIVEAALADTSSRELADWVRIGAAAGVDRWHAEAVATLNGDPCPRLLKAAADRLRLVVPVDAA